tara:strand:+ start:1678 stop:1830 length:153 start_codon:yes stop_codon:yes gene_type:complete
MESEIFVSLQIKAVAGMLADGFEEHSYYRFSMFVELFMANANAGVILRGV